MATTHTGETRTPLSTYYSWVHTNYFPTWAHNPFTRPPTLTPPVLHDTLFLYEESHRLVRPYVPRSVVLLLPPSQGIHIRTHSGGHITYADLPCRLAHHVLGSSVALPWSVVPFPVCSELSDVTSAGPEVTPTSAGSEHYPIGSGTADLTRGLYYLGLG